MRVVRAIDFCFGHRLLQYEGNCKNVHGHNARAEISLSSDVLNKSGMVVDFNEIRDVVKKWIDDNWDHGFLANEYDDAMLGFLISNRQKYYAVRSHLNPVSAEVGMVAVTASANPTMENLSRILFNVVQQKFPNHEVSVTLFESPNGWAETP